MMLSFIAVISFLAFLVFIVSSIVSTLKKKGKGKRNLIISGICFVIFIAATASLPPSDKGTLASGQVPTPKPENSPKAETVKVTKEEKQKAKAEAAAKEKADKAAKILADNKAKEKAAAEEKAAAIEKAPHLGESTGVGNLGVVLGKDIKFTQSVGSEYLNQEAQGMYWVFNVGVKNGDKKARMIDTTMFQLISDDGTKYDPDPTASMYANDAGKFFLQSINPGIQANGFIVFDMPPELKNKVANFKLKVDSGVGFAAGKSVEFILKNR